MQINFESGHVTGSFSNRRLSVAIGVENRRCGQTVWERIHFSVPPDFHAHNDAVAAALMTLVGRRFSEVTFNFPISAHCAEKLRAYYSEIEFSPVDLFAEPRRPGTRLGLNFSGGMDSTAVWLLLRELYGDDFLVITSEYGGFSAFEEIGYGAFHRDVSCRTNLREKRFDRDGRFNFCVPLLYADYLGLGQITTGHSMAHTPDGLFDHRDGTRPGFLNGDLVVNAAGVDDLHLIRSLCGVGVAKVILTFGPERIEGALEASSPARSGKPYTGAMLFRHLYADAGLPLPAFLRDYPPLQRPMSGNTLRLLYLIKRDGIEATAAYAPEVARFDRSFFAGVTLKFMERYNPVFVDLISQSLRGRVVDLFRRCGIDPYDDRDWDELSAVRRFVKANVPVFKDIDD